LRVRIHDLLGGVAVGNAAGNDADRHARSPDTRLTTHSRPGTAESKAIGSGPWEATGTTVRLAG
jgi:hypothetical protein